MGFLVNWVLVVLLLFCEVLAYPSQLTTENIFKETTRYFPTTTLPTTSVWNGLFKKNLTSFMKLHSHGNKKYFINSEFKASYIEAVTFCQEIHMQLVTIPNNEENEALLSYIRNNNRGDAFWTSATKLLDGYHWVWMPSFETVSYTNWKKGEPSHTNEYCLLLSYVKSSGLYWMDYDCNVKQYFICETKLEENNIATDGGFSFNRRDDMFRRSYMSPSIALFHHEQKSYFFGRYIKATYLEAVQFCNIMSMHLVSIRSIEENSQLHKYIRDTSAGDKFWSSGNRLMDGKSWIWMTNAEPIEYTNWGNNEPDNLNHQCIQLDDIKNDGLFWNDYDCNSRNYYICEKSRKNYYGGYYSSGDNAKPIDFYLNPY